MKCVINSNITEDHAVLLVGYTKQYWIIKNQWGPDWGQNGFMRITRHPDYNCLMGVEVDLMYEQFTSRGVLLLTLMILFLNYD